MPLQGSRRHTRPDKDGFQKLIASNRLYQSDRKFIEYMRCRRTSCVMQFAKETDAEHCFWKPFEAIAPDKVKFVNPTARLLLTLGRTLVHIFDYFI